LSLTSQKYGFGIRDPEKAIPDPGSRIQGKKDTGSRIRIRNTEFFMRVQSSGLIRTKIRLIILLLWQAGNFMVGGRLVTRIFEEFQPPAIQSTLADFLIK
jgi:hypothetical protein